MRQVRTFAVMVLLVVASTVGAHARSPEAVAAWNEGRWLLENMRPSQAIAAFSRAITLDPAFGEAWFQRGAAWYQRGQAQRLRGFPVSLDDSRQAQANFERALELGVPRAEVLHARGLVHADLLDWWRALRDYDEALRSVASVPEPPRAQARRLAFIHNDRANAWAQLGRFREAIRDYTRAITFNKKRMDTDRADATWYNAQFYRNRARALAMIGHNVEARRDLKEAVTSEVAGPQIHPRR